MGLKWQIITRFRRISSLANKGSHYDRSARGEMRIGPTALTDNDTKKSFFEKNGRNKEEKKTSWVSAVDYRSHGYISECVSESTQETVFSGVCVCVHESGDMDSIQTHGLLPSYRRACPLLSRHIDAESFNANLFTTHTHTHIHTHTHTHKQSHRGSNKSQVRE